MLHKFVLAVGILGISQLVSAAPITCTAGSLASYIALGSAGCTIGSNILSSFQTFTGLTGSTPISPQNITITPVGGNTNPGITVQTNTTANPGQILDTLLGYMLSGNAYTGESIALSNTSSSGNGGVTDIQNFCLGGAFGTNGVTGCSGKAGNSLLLGNGGNQSTFASVNKISVTDDLTLDSGGTGSASGGSFTDQFTATAVSAVPEPSTLMLAGLGIALAVFGKARNGFVKEMKR